MDTISFLLLALRPVLIRLQGVWSTKELALLLGVFLQECDAVLKWKLNDSVYPEV